MLGAGKYKVTIGATLLLFVWILLTDVLGRWTTTVSMVMEMQEHEVLTSENLEMKKLELMEAKKSLLSSSPGTGMQIASCATDVFEFIASCASQANIVLELMEPTGVDGEGPVQELAFRVRCETDFHTAGRFISAVENDGVGG